MDWKLDKLFLISVALIGFFLLPGSTAHSENGPGQNYYNLAAKGSSMFLTMGDGGPGRSTIQRPGQYRTFQMEQLAPVKAVSDSLITGNSVGPVRLGMTVAQARRALGGFTLSRTSDGEGIALIAIKRRKQTVMTLYAGEQDPRSRINERAKIEFIEAWDASYHTADGVRPKMPLREVEQKYGQLKEIRLSQIEAREFATFATQPGGIQMRVANDTGMTGIYNEGQNTTTRYSHSAYLKSISITGRGNATPQLSSRHTDPQQSPQLNRGESETLEDFAKRIIPQGMQLAHQPLEGRLGPSQKSLVILFEADKASAKSYKGWVLAPAGLGHEKYALPDPRFTWSVEEPKVVFLANADKDPGKELFIIAACYTGVGPTGAQPFNRTRVYDWSGKGFTHLEAVSRKIGTAATAPAVRKKLMRRP